MSKQLTQFPAIATAYAGFNFRSRLEAKYAVFFDLCRWPWTYEPETDFNGWLPDFALGSFPTFVEIKPFYRLAEWEDQKAKIQASGCRDDVLCFGADPTFIAAQAKTECHAAYGWSGRNPKFGGVYTESGYDETYYNGIRPVEFGKYPEPGGCGLSVVDDGGWKHFTMGHVGGSECELFGDLDSNMEVLKQRWATACNTVQWMPRVTTP